MVRTKQLADVLVVTAVFDLPADLGVWVNNMID
jgi:hypothetical protein